MSVFLQLDEKGRKAAFSAKFWHAATEEMMALEPKAIWAYMRENGWVRKEREAARSARCVVNQSKAEQEQKNILFEQSTVGMDMSVFLKEVDGKKAALFAKFWHEATPAMMAFNTKVIRKFLRDNGWVKKEIDRAMNTRYQVTPEGREANNAIQKARTAIPEIKAANNARAKARNAIPEVRAANRARDNTRNKTPERRKKRNARDREKRATRKGKMLSTIRSNNKRILAAIKENHLNIDMKEYKKQIKTKNGTYDVDLYDAAIEKTLPPGITMQDWAEGKTNLTVDHKFPLDVAVLYDHMYTGMLVACNSPDNLAFLNESTNISKGKKVILELVPKNFPGYPFIELRNMKLQDPTNRDIPDFYHKIEDAGLNRDDFKNYIL